MKDTKSNILITTSSDFRIDKKILRDIVKDILNSLNKSFEKIGIYFLNDSDLLKINRNFLDHDYFTDIITFSYSNSEPYSCEMFISYERALENARKFKNSFGDEILRLIVHGLLHTLGFKDKSSKEKKRIRQIENKILSSLKKKNFIK